MDGAYPVYGSADRNNHHILVVSGGIGYEISNTVQRRIFSVCAGLSGTGFCHYASEGIIAYFSSIMHQLSML